MSNLPKDYLESIQNTLQSLNWRYAVKQFDPQKKLAPEEVQLVAESLRLSASSFGLQLWKFLIISNPEIRSRLKEASWGQSQVTDASHMVVFCTYNQVQDNMIDSFIALTAQTRNVPPDSLKNYEDVIKNFVNKMPEDKKRHWLDRQVYIALGNLLTVCALNGIDTCPMEGLGPDQYDEILGLAEQNLHCVVACAIGHRSSEDKYGKALKVRFPQEQVVRFYE